MTLAYTYDVATRLTAASDNASAYASTCNANGLVTSVDNQGTPNVPRVVPTSRHVYESHRIRAAHAVSGRR